MDESDLSRRRFLKATGGAAAAAALAGCSGGGGNGNGSGGNGSGGNGTSGGAGGTQTQAETTTQGDTATEGGDTATEGEGNASEGNASDGNQSARDPMKGSPGKTDKTHKTTNSTMTTFDPIAATDTASGSVIMQVFDALTNYPSGKTSVENLLTKEYETSNGGKTYTFTLVDGATFSNGDPVTAQDFVYSFKRLAASKNSKRTGFILGDLGVKATTNDEGKVNLDSLGVKAKDKRTLVLELKQPTPAALEILAYAAFSAVPEGIVGDIPGSSGKMSYQKFSLQNPIGAGPYTLKTYKSGTEAEVSARDDYYGKGPQTAGTHWQIIEQDSAAYAYTVTNRNADYPSIPTAKYNKNKISKEGENENGQAYGTYGKLANGLTADFYRTQELSCYYYGFNCKSVPRYVRKAIAYVNNNQTPIEEIYKRPRKAAYHFVPPKIYPGGTKAYDKHAKKYPYGYKKTNIQKARQLMKENGHGRNNPYKFTMTSYTSKSQQRVLNILRDKLRQVGIQMSVKQTTFSTLVEQAYSGNTDAYTLGWIADWPQPANFLKLLYPPATDTSSGSNVSGFNWLDSKYSKQAKQAWEKIQDNPQPEKGKQARNEAVVSMLEAVWQGVPMITTTHSVAQHMEYPWVYKPRIGAMGGSRAKHNKVEIGERQG